MSSSSTSAPSSSKATQGGSSSNNSSTSGGTTTNSNSSSTTSGAGFVNSLINNNSGPSRESTPLLPTGDSHLPHHHHHPNNNDHHDGIHSSRVHLKGVTWLVGVALIVAALLFALLAFKHTRPDTVPFPHVTHPLQPTPLWGAVRKPYPTGAWWTNLVLNKGMNNVAVLPYAIKATEDDGIQVSYSYFRHLSTAMVQADLFAADMSMAAVENATTHYVESYDPLSVGLVFPTVAHLQHNRPSYYRTHLVRGCPYITIEYYGCKPQIYASNMITVINGLQFLNDAAFDTPALTDSIFDITVISGQQWLLFADPPITLQWTKDGKLTAMETYTGYIRLAVAPQEEVKSVLVEHWRAYPTGGDVLLDYQQEDEDMITYQWRRKGEGRLLMLALPHHVEILQDATTVVNATNVYQTLKGGMTGVLGDRWYLKESLPQPLPDSSQKKKTSSSSKGESSTTTTTTTTAAPSLTGFHAPRPIATSEQVEAIKDAIHTDLAAIRKGDWTRWNKTDTADPYWEGKKMAMYARLALIADEVGMHAESQEAIKLAEGVLEPWLVGGTQNPLLYDTTWGGLVLQRGISNPYIDFGNTYYNDHHFMYGYFVYTGAVIAKFDMGFVTRHKAALRSLVQDIANDDDTNPSFPLARHKDFFDGHSWASGLFVQNNGKSQESSSEAINAYYGAHLYGRATGDKKLERFARLLLAMEIRSTRWYWHMPNNTQIYDPIFAANRMVGVVGGLDCTCHTWFGEKYEFVHGINFMPFTPVTEAFLDPSYVTEEYPVLATVLNRPDDPVEEEWLGFIYLDHAIIDPVSAWEEVKTLTKFDSGNSLSNCLWWVATRPGAEAAGGGGKKEGERRGGE